MDRCLRGQWQPVSLRVAVTPRGESPQKRRKRKGGRAVSSLQVGGNSWVEKRGYRIN